jgi:hypothetical protein
MKANRSALMVFAAVVGMPCGKAFWIPFVSQFGGKRRRVSVTPNLIVIAMHHQHLDSDLLEVVREVSLRKCDASYG